MEINIRAAQQEEIEVLFEFEKGIIEAERPFDTTLKNGKIHYYDLSELIKSPESEVVIAVANGQIVGSGYAKVKVAEPYLKHTHFAYLGFMYVKPEFRGKDINKMIFKALIHWAKTKGLSEIRLEVYDENIAAKKAYLKVGFKPNLLEMRMEV